MAMEVGAEEEPQSSQHSPSPQPPGEPQEGQVNGAKEGILGKDGEGSCGHMEDGVQQAGSSASASVLVGWLAAQLQAPGPEETSSLQAASLGQGLCHSTPKASRESSWLSRGPSDTLEGLEGQASQTKRGPSPLSVDSKERQEQVLATAYRAEDGATWVSQQMRREVTNRSQQTSTVWSRGTLPKVLTSPGQKSVSSTNAESQLVKQSSGECPGTPAAGRPLARHASRLSSRWSQHQTELAARKESRHGSQRALRQQPQPVQKKPEEQNKGSALAPSSKVVMELEVDSGSLQGIELMVEKNNQRHKFFIGLSDAAEQKCNILSASGENLMCRLASKMMKSHGEQASEAGMKTNEETAEQELFPQSTAALEDAEVTYNLTSLEGGMKAGNMRKILVIPDKETGNTVIKTVHETTQISQQSLHSHDAGGKRVVGFSAMCGEAEAEVLQLMSYQPRDSGRESRNAEMALELLVASDGRRDAHSMDLPSGTISEAQQTSSIISLEEGIWIKRKTGKLLRNKSQQTTGGAPQE